jgi:type II secretory pathway component PulK
VNASLKSRRGVVLLSVLAMLALVGTTSLLTASRARASVAASRHRVDTMRLQWIARGCLARARALADRTLREVPDGRERNQRWRALQHVGELSFASDDGRCIVDVRAVGTRADINALDSVQLVRLASTVVDSRSAEEIAANVLDWRDADDEPRAGGAEREWYELRARSGPRNADVLSDAEIRLIRGLASRPHLSALLTTERGLVSAIHAPREVLAAIAGEDAAVLAHVLERRLRTTELEDVRSLLVSSDTVLARLLQDSYGVLSAWLTVDPEAWWATAQATDAASPIVVQVQHRWRRTRDAVWVAEERVR